MRIYAGQRNLPRVRPDLGSTLTLKRAYETPDARLPNEIRFAPLQSF
jgi:hypothetical protein